MPEAGGREPAVVRQIIAATETLLEDLPFRDLTVEAVAETAGVSQETFSRHFPDLESVLLRGLAEVADELHLAAGKWLDAASDPHATVDDAGRSLIGVWVQHGYLIRAFADAAAIGPPLDEAWYDIVTGFDAPTAARIEQLNQQGLASVENPYQTARALSWMLASYLLDTFGRPSEVTPEVALQTLGTIWRRAIFRREGEA